MDGKADHLDVDSALIKPYMNHFIEHLLTYSYQQWLHFQEPMTPMTFMDTKKDNV